MVFTDRLATVAILLLVTLVDAAPPTKDEKPCTAHVDGEYYDLNPLNSRQDYLLESPGGHALVLNLCGSVSHNFWGLRVPDRDQSQVAGFMRGDNGDFSIGKTNTSLRIVPPPPDSKEEPQVQLIFTGGSACRGPPPQADSPFNSSTYSELSTPAISASTVVTLICDLEKEGDPGPRLLNHMPPGDDSEACVFVFEWHTQVACAAGKVWTTWDVVKLLALMVISSMIIAIILVNPSFFYYDVPRAVCCVLMAIGYSVAIAWAYMGAKAMVIGGFVREKASVVTQYGRNFWENVLTGYGRAGLERAMDGVDKLRGRMGKGRGYERMVEEVGRDGAGGVCTPTGGREGGAFGKGTSEEMEEREFLTGEEADNDRKSVEEEA